MEYFLTPDEPDFQPLLRDAIDYGSHLVVYDIPKEWEDSLFSILAESRNLFSLSIVFEEEEETSEEISLERLFFLQNVAEALHRNSVLAVVDLRDWKTLTSEEIHPLLACRGLEELWVSEEMIHSANDAGENLLHLCVKEKNRKLAASFIKQGAAFSSKDKRGYTPILLAQTLEATSEQQEMSAFLRQAAYEKIASLAFGKSDWEKYFGFIDDKVSFPPHILEILESPCPFWSQKRVHDTHLLVFVPEKVKGKPLSLDYLEQLILNPQKGGYATSISQGFDLDSKRIVVDTSHWVLMTRDVLPSTKSYGYREHSYEEQLQRLEEYSRRVLPIADWVYRPPQVLEALVCLGTTYAKKGRKFYTGNNEHGIFTYTHCEEQMPGRSWHMRVGGFDDDTLFVNQACYERDVGLGALVRFF